MNKKQTKIIATLGPSTNQEEDLQKIKDQGVDFVRINMSHSTLDDLAYFINMSQQVGVPFIIDTEGSQVRTGDLNTEKITLQEGDKVKIYKQEIKGNERKINLKPGFIVEQLTVGDLVHVDFNSLILRISDTSTLEKEGYVTATAATSGSLGRNKAVVIDPGLKKKFVLPPLSEKDYKSIELGLKKGVKHVAASFMRSKESVEEVRKASQGKMKIISKIECVDALENLEEILKATDYILIDRGDLSKEIPIEKIPLAQKILISKANELCEGAFVATNLLESMIEQKKPTRAEAHDVVQTILDGAYGLTLAAETAIGKNPLKCINVINKLIRQAELAKQDKSFENKDLIGQLQKVDYLLSPEVSASLTAPHGGGLIDRYQVKEHTKEELSNMIQVQLDESLQMDIEQIGIGTFSPLEGFMGKADYQGVLDDMRLENGLVWTIPIILDVSQEVANKVKLGQDIALLGDEGVMATMQVDEKYAFDQEEFSQKFYGTTDKKHPGVAWTQGMKPVLLGGKINLLKRRQSENKEYELSPKQVRALFKERDWIKVVGFHTRNVIHRSHEFIQIKAMQDNNCDGLFVHPVIGKKKAGDFKSEYIIESYEDMMKHFYPKEKVIFATFSTFSRYAGPREAVFTALCRKNFGCSHFIIGRDHTGVGDFYHPKASHEIFDKFSDLGIEVIKYDNVYYSKKNGQHVHDDGNEQQDQDDKLCISGTQARETFVNGKQPPRWFMRPEISSKILEYIKKGKDVFVK